jgi:uncharacterized damage-inducible protein DinB
MCQTMVNYNEFLNRKLWDSIFTLTDEQFTSPVDFSHGSVRNHMVHLAGVDGRWVRGLRGEPDARSFKPIPEDFPTRQAGFELWEATARDLRKYVKRLKKKDLVSKPSGMQEPAWQIILHLVNHATDHGLRFCASFTIWAPPLSTRT